MKFWEVKNISSNEGELILYGEIMSSRPWWEAGQIIAPTEFIEDIALLKDKSKIIIRINSFGGDPFAALAIHDHLKQMKCYKEARIEGIVASAATIIPCACDNVLISPGGAYMIHNPAVTVWDSLQEGDLEQLKNMLASVKNSLIETYKSKTGLLDEELSQMMDAESWMTGRQAVEKGFCDALMEGFTVTNSFLNNRICIVNNVAHDLSRFKNMPVFEKQNDVSNKEGGKKEMKLEDLKKEHPELVAEIEKGVRAEAVKQERQRIQDIEKISNTISPELVNKAKYDEPIDASVLAFKALEQNQLNAQAFMKNLNDDSADSGAKNVGSGNQGEGVKKSAGLTASLNNDKRRK